MIAGLGLLCLGLPVLAAPPAAFVAAAICVVKERTASAWLLGLATAALVGGWMAVILGLALGGGPIGALAGLGCTVLGNGLALEAGARMGTRGVEGVHPGAFYTLGLIAGLAVPWALVCVGGEVPLPLVVPFGLWVSAGVLWASVGGVAVGFVGALRALPVTEPVRDWA